VYKKGVEEKLLAAVVLVAVVVVVGKKGMKRKESLEWGFFF